MVSKLLPYWQFDMVVGARPCVPKKPDRAAVLEIADQLNIPPSEFLCIGDTDTDMKTAKAAGMCPTGVLWGFRTAAEELSASGARALIQNPMDLLGIL